MSEFRRELGLLDAIVVVIGGIVGVGIFANPSNVARIVDTPAQIVLAWALGGVVALLGGFIWAELGSRFPFVGGQYVYLARAYPPVVGFLYGIALLFIINGGSLAAVSIIFGTYVGRMFVPLSPAGVHIVAALALMVLTAVNVAGVRAGKVTNNVLMAVKIAGILALVWLAFGRSGPSASPLTMDVAGAGSAPPGFVGSGFSRIDSMGSGFSRIDATVDTLRALLTAMVPILFAYGGWQSCGSLAAEIRNPARNLARANVLGVLVVIALYLALNLAYLRVLTPAAIAASPAVAADMAMVAAGEFGARFVALLIVVSSLGFLAVVILTGPRLYYAMAQDGLFFRRAGRLHARYGTPVFALWFQAGVSLVLLATNTYDQLLSYVVFADWLFFGLTAGALFIVRRRGDPEGEAVRAPGHPFTTGAFVLVAIGVVVNSFFVYPVQSLIGSAILLAAAGVYVAMRAARSRA